jgi:N-acetylglucosamine malate deacetylase 2
MQVASLPRTLVIAAHPDDETIGAGVLISRMKGVQVVHATEGSPTNPSDALASGFSSREGYAAARRVETARALALAGLAESAIWNLHFTDQQLCSQLEDLSLRIVGLLEQWRPNIVLTHAYEGGHPDHDSVALACHLARELHAKRAPEFSFDLVEFTCYHAGSDGIRAYEFLPCDDGGAQTYRLTASERELKVGMLRQFTTQTKTLAAFMSPEFERFRVAPRYDFRRAPHEGKLFYENFNWGVDGATWRELASRTLSRLVH